MAIMASISFALMCCISAAYLVSVCQGSPVESYGSIRLYRRENSSTGLALPGLDGLSGLVSSVTNLLPGLLPQITGIVMNITDSIQKIVSCINITQLTDTISSLGGTDLLSSVTSSLANPLSLLTNLPGLLLGLLPKILSLPIDLLKKLVPCLLGNVLRILLSVLQLLQKLLSPLLDPLKSLLGGGLGGGGLPLVGSLFFGQQGGGGGGVGNILGGT